MSNLKSTDFNRDQTLYKITGMLTGGDSKKPLITILPYSVCNASDLAIQMRMKNNTSEVDPLTYLPPNEINKINPPTFISVSGYRGMATEEKKDAMLNAVKNRLMLELQMDNISSPEQHFKENLQIHVGGRRIDNAKSQPSQEYAL